MADEEQPTAYDVENLLDIVDYFASKADSLEAEALSAKIFDNPVDKGDVRESILLEFLDDHLPKRCGAIRGGFVFNQFGNRSKQIDLIVTTDSNIQFKRTYGKHETKSFTSIEGVLAAISIKSTLDKKEFFDALDNFVYTDVKIICTD